VAPAGVEKLTYSSGTIEPCPTTTLSTMRIPHRFHRHVPRRTNIVPRTLQSTYQCFKCPGDKGNGNVGDNTALLIDADNVSYKKLSALMSEVNKDGTANVRRIYGDWTRTPMKIWQHGLMQHSIVPIQQFAYATGKNSTDGAMMVDAMDLLHTNRFSRFCLITSDSDFTRLASRIREQGVSVHGFGNKNVTHQALAAACTKFSYLEDLGATSDETSKEAVLVVPRTPVTPASPSTSWGPVFGNSSPASTTQLLPASQTETRFTQDPAISHKKPLDRAAIEAIRSTIIEHQYRADKDCFLNAKYVKQRLVRLSPDLHYTNHGYSKLADFLMASGIVELKWTDNTMLVRLTDKQNAITTAHNSVPFPPREETAQADPSLPSQGPVKLGRKPHDRIALESIRAAVLEECQDDASSFVDLSGVCLSLRRLSPALALSDYGYSRAGRFIQASGIVEVEMKGRVPFVRLKDGWRDTISSTAITTTEPLTTSVPLSPPTEVNPATSNAKPLNDPAALEGIRRLIVYLNQGDEDSFVDLENLERNRTSLSPETAAALDYKNHGYPTLLAFIQASGVVELKHTSIATLVRLKHEPIDQAALEAIRTTINNNIWGNKDSFASLDMFANDYVHKQPPDLHYRNYGYSRLHDFLLAAGIVELKTEQGISLIRLKDEQRDAITTTATKSHTPQSASPSEEISTPTMLGRKPLDQAALEGIRQTILSLRNGEDSFVRLADFIRHYSTEQPPALHPQNYGFWRWRSFLRESGIVKLSRDETGGLIGLRDRHTTSTAATTTTTTEEAPLLPNTFDSTALKALRTVVANSPRYRGGSFVKTSDVRYELLRQSPELNPENYGYSRFDVFLLASGLVEMHTVENRTMVRLWDDYELGPASKAKRDRNMRQMMLRYREDDKGALLESKVEHDHDGHEHKTSSAYVSWDTGNKCGTRSMMNEDKHKWGKEETPPKSEVKREHEQSRGLDTSFALVAFEAEDERKTSLESVRGSHDDQDKTSLALLVNGHVAPSESKEDNGIGQETSLASASPSEPDVHEHEHERQTPLLKSEDEHKIKHETSSSAPATLHINLNEDAQQGIGMPLTLDIGPEHDDTSNSPLVSKGDEHETSTTSKHEPEHEHNTSLVQKDETQPEPGHDVSTSLDSEAEHEPGPEPEPEPEPEVEPEPKPKTTPLASLAQSFSYSERR